MADNANNKFWAVILGASSGFGEAASKKLAEDGYNIIGVHLDRQATMPNVEKIINYIKSKNVQVKFFNANAADEAKRIEIINEINKFCKWRGYCKSINAFSCFWNS